MKHRGHYFPDRVDAWSSDHVLALLQLGIKPSAHDSADRALWAVALGHAPAPSVLRAMERYVLGHEHDLTEEWLESLQLPESRLRELGLVALRNGELDPYRMGPILKPLPEEDFFRGVNERRATRPPSELIVEMKELAMRGRIPAARAWLRNASFDPALAPYVLEFISHTSSPATVLMLKKSGINRELLCDALARRVEVDPQPAWLRFLADSMTEARPIPLARAMALRHIEAEARFRPALAAWDQREKLISSSGSMAISPP